jgi:hypothetical protein
MLAFYHRRFFEASVVVEKPLKRFAETLALVDHLTEVRC